MGNKPGRDFEEESQGHPNTRPSRLAKAGANSLGGNQQYDQSSSATQTRPEIKANSSSAQPPSSSSSSSSSTSTTATSSSNSKNSSSSISTSYHDDITPTNSTSSTRAEKPNSSGTRSPFGPEVTRTTIPTDNMNQFKQQNVIKPTPYDEVPFVPPPQTKLWEQQQQIQLQIGRQQRKTPFILEPPRNFDGLINGRSSGFDPDRFKRANFKYGDAMITSSSDVAIRKMNGTARIQQELLGTTSSSSTSSPLVTTPMRENDQLRAESHHSSPKPGPTCTGSVNTLDNMDESLMDDILQDIGL